ncbi:MAG: type II secretion system protein [Kofleriaceae bacterium]|nr:type II secretion system protein [Kofleriaceae bacterium]
MTVIEIMVVLAIIGGGALLVRSGFRMVSKADLVENSTELAVLMRRTSQLAIEMGEMHRMVFDLDKQIYRVEVCQGAATILRNEELDKDPEKQKDALERAKARLNQVPADAFSTDPEEAAKRITALAGQHVGDRTCQLVTDWKSGDIEAAGAKRKDVGNEEGADNEWIRALRVHKGIKFKEIWVQHLEKSVTKGQVAIYFFPRGTSEKAVVEVTDGDASFTVLVHGLSGRVELRDGKLDNVDDHMLRNIKGEREKERDAEGEKR